MRALVSATSIEKIGGIGHAVDGEDVAVGIGDGDHHARPRAQRQADGGARDARAVDGILHDLADVFRGERAAGERTGQPAIGGGRAVAGRDVECAARARSGARGGGIHERQAEAVEIDGARVGQRKFDEEAGGLRGAGGGILVLVVGIEAGDADAADHGESVAEERQSTGHGRHPGAVRGARGVQQTRIELAGQIGHVEIAASIGVLDAEQRARGLIGNALREN